jgi:hypothetical protein
MQWLRVGEYTTTVSEEWSSKHVPVEMNTQATIDLVLEMKSFLCVRAEML